MSDSYTVKKEILIKVRDIIQEQDDTHLSVGNSMCFILLSLLNKGVIDYWGYSLVYYYIKANKPKNTNDTTDGLWWPKERSIIRLRFLNKHIAKLTL